MTLTEYLQNAVTAMRRLAYDVWHWLFCPLHCWRDSEAEFSNWHTRHGRHP